MINRLYAKGNTDIEGFTDRLKIILDAAWGKDWGKFTAETPKYGDDTEPMPQISYLMMNRVPSTKTTKNIKPALYDTYPDPDNPGETVSEYRQWYDCILHFTCWDNSVTKAMIRAEQLEEFIFTYTGIFKDLGIAEIIFKEMSRPDVNMRYRQDIPYVTISYYVRLERIHERRSIAIKFIEEQINVKNQDGKITQVYPPSLNEERDIILKNAYLKEEV